MSDINYSELVEDPIKDELDFVKTPSEDRKGPVADDLDDQILSDNGESYHQQDPTVGHMSASAGCSRKNYLNYIHKLRDNLEPIDNTAQSLWVFEHGDLIHEKMQDMFVRRYGKEHVTVEETIEIEITENYSIYGHADLVIRDLDRYPDPFVIDIKTKKDFTYYNRGKGGHALTIPARKNVMQLNGYLKAIGANYGGLLYYSKKEDEMQEYWFSFQKDLWEEAKNNIINVLDSVNNSEAPDKDASSYMCCDDYCKYYREGLCSGVDSDNSKVNEGDELT